MTFDKRIVSFTAGALIASGYLLVDLAPVSPVTAQLPYCTVRTQPPTIQARAAYAFGASTKSVLYEKNADAQLPLASLTKVMTVITALDMIGPTSTVRITSDMLVPEGESGLRAGEVWEAQALADFTLMTSSNDGARALMLTAAAQAPDAHFFDAMNRRARALGLASTYFISDTGLDVSAVTAGAYGSARDMAHLMHYVADAHADTVQYSTSPHVTFVTRTGAVHTAQNTSLLAATLAAPRVSKTGYTDLAGGNLAVVFEPIPGHPVAIAVLGSTREGRDRDVAALAEYSTAELRRILTCASYD